jgi:hypothetical protein
VREFLAGLRRWWLRRFRGVVVPPAQYGGQGTTWQQHRENEWAFVCACKEMLTFTQADYVIREQEHDEDCEFQYKVSSERCSCRVTDARYVKICPDCRRGHWKQAA